MGKYIFFIGLFCAVAGNADTGENVQVARCYPNDAEAKKWPIKVIYLHGLFTETGRSGSEMERNNRETLKDLADRMREQHMRIAVPVSGYLSSKRERQWWNKYKHLSLAEVEALAIKACGGAPLAEPRAIIGFSNGGYEARALALLPCDQNSAYAKILAIGAPNTTQDGKCGRDILVNKTLHEFPNVEYFEKNLAPLSNTPNKIKLRNIPKDGLSS
jgi:hypothetical protein